MKNSFQKITGLFLILLMVLALAGCSGQNGSSSEQDANGDSGAVGSSDDSQESSADSSDVSDGFSIEMWSQDTSLEESGAARLAKAWTEEFNETAETKLHITNIMGGDANTYTQKLILATNSGTLPELFWGVGTAMTGIPTSGELLDITEYIDNDPEWTGYYNDGAWDLHFLVSEGRKYGIPLKTEIQGFFYNKRLFDENNLEIPETWEQFTKAVQVFKEAGILPIAHGGADSWARWGYDLFFARYGLHENLEGILDGSIPFAEVGVPAMEKVQELAELGAYPENVSTMTHTQASELFYAGEAAMFTVGSWDTNNLEKAAEAENFVFNWGPIFSDSEYDQKYACKTTSWSLWVSKKVGNDPELQETILSFLKYVSGPEGTSALPELNKEMPPTKYTPSEDTAVSPLFLQMIDKLGDDYKGVGEMSFYFDPTFQDIYWTAVTAVITQTATPEEAAQQVQDVIDLVLEG